MKKALVVEDDKQIKELIELQLKDLFFDIKSTMNGKNAMDLIKSEPFDLIILDIMLPGMDGLEICKKARALDINTPIIMLTARSEEIDKVLGLETGADDYITKPFSVREFQARVKAVVRRASNSESQNNQSSKTTFSYKEILIDGDKRKVEKKGERIDLTTKEFELLYLLANNPGKSYNRSQILNLVWGYDFEGFEHTVNSHINRLRAKIEDDMADPTYILTTWGYGYRFNEDL